MINLIRRRFVRQSFFSTHISMVYISKGQALVQVMKKYHFIVHMYTCRKADDQTQVPVLNGNDYRVIDITRLG